MLCTRCYGTRTVDDHGGRRPCPDCGGVGQVHCCDALVEEPDLTGADVPTPETAAGETCPVADRPRVGVAIPGGASDT